MSRHPTASALDRWWAASGIVSIALFACGPLFADLLGSSSYPAVDAPAGEVRRSLLDNAPEVRALAFFHLLSALALLCFAGYLRALLRRAGTADDAAALVFAASAMAAVFLLLSALLYRALCKPVVATAARAGARRAARMAELVGDLVALPRGRHRPRDAAGAVPGHGDERLVNRRVAHQLSAVRRPAAAGGLGAHRASRPASYAISSSVFTGP